MHSEFEMSMMGELNFFLGLQIKQLKEGTFINQVKYIRDLLKRFNMEKSKTMKTPMSSSIKLDKDKKYLGPRASDLGRLLLCSRVTANFRTFPRERWLPLGHRASAQLSRLSLLRQRLTKGRNINFSQLQHFGFEGLFSRMGWLLVVTAIYGLGGPLISTVRGVEIQLDPESIYCIFNIPPVGLKDFRTGKCLGMGKPSAHSLTVSSRVLHQMIYFILLPRGGHRDEVYYLEAFLVDSILIGRRIHLGYLMMMHMISCYESSTHVLSYARFLTKVFKNARVHPGVEEEPEIREMEGGLDPQRGFEQREPELDIPLLQSESIRFEATFSESMISEPTYIVGPSSQPSFTELLHTETSPHQAPHVPNHALLGTRMKEFAVVSDTRFYSMEDRMDRYQTGFTSQFEYVQ
ncbi:hypothetical protein AAG906_013014 [Vitis piasezkii]